MNRYSSYKDSGVEWIGEIPNHWIKTKLKHVSEIITGNTPPTKDSDNYEGGIFLWVKPNEINEFIPTNNTKEKLTEKGKSLSRVLPPLSVLVNGIGRIGEFGYSELNVSTNQQINSIVFDSKVNKWFGIYHVFFMKEGFTSNSEKVVVPILNKTKQGNLNFVLPPLSEQQQIVSFLDNKTQKIDYLIQQKEKKIELLKEKKTSLINHVVTKGIDPNVEMKDSGVEWIGEIPSGWDFVKVGHYTNVVRGGSPRPSGDPRFFNGGFIHWITVKDITSKKGKYVTNTLSKLTKEGMKQSRVLEPETLVLTNSGVTLGVPGILKIQGCINDGSVGFLNLSEKLERDYLYYFWTTQTELLLEQQSGYGQPNLNIDIVSNVKFPLPSKNKQQQIVEYLDKQTEEIETLIQLEQKKIDTLKEYRQSLISEVVTGKIKVV